MLTRLAGASVRAALVAATVAVPSVMLPDVSPISAELSVLIAAIAAAFVIIEYGFSSPSLVEFRFAAPYNRCRFAILAVLLFLLVFAFRGKVESTTATLLVSTFSVASVEFWDFGLSPLQSFLSLVKTTGPDGVDVLANAAALALSVAAIGVVFLSVIVWAFAWPLGRENFNLWINMPTFDVSGTRSALPDLRRSATMSLIFGLSFPYLAPQAALGFLGPLEPISAGNSHLMVWVIAIWCFVPAVALLRGVALVKVAKLMAGEYADNA